MIFQIEGRTLQEVITLVIIVASIALVLIIVFYILIKRKKDIRSKKPKVVPIMSKVEHKTEEEFDKKTRLFGMIKAEKKINLKTADEYIGMEKKDMRAMIYDLVGEGKIEGEFQGDLFVIKSDIDDFIKVLDSSFLSWEEKEKHQSSKI